jgi:mannose-1-phosphate guanylyltransferase
MEKAREVRCIQASFRWSDVGSFPALADHLPHDASENAVRARIATHDAHGNVAWSTDPDELIALVGVSGLVVVRAGKRTLVTTKDRAEDIKKLVEKLPKEDTE